MGGQAGGGDPDAPRLAERPGDAQHAKLGLGIEAVAGLDLDGRHPFGDQPVETRQRRGHQRLCISGPRRRDGRADAPARPRDLLVARALEAHLELARAVAAMHEMGVTVDQRRRRDPPALVEPGPAGEAPGQIRPGAGPGDPPLRESQRPARHEAVSRRIHGRERQPAQHHTRHRSPMGRVADPADGPGTARPGRGCRIGVAICSPRLRARARRGRLGSDPEPEARR